MTIKASGIAAQVPYHATSTAPLSTHDVRLPKESTVGDLLAALMQQLPADKRPKELRLLEIFNGKIYQVSTLFSFEDSSYREQLHPRARGRPSSTGEM